MLNAHLVSRGVTPRRDIADRPDVRRAGAADVVADDAVVDLDAAAVQPVGGRARADADHDQIGVELGAVRQAPPSRRGRSRVTSATPTPQRTSTPSARCSRATSAPICSPSTEASGVGCGSTRTTVDAQPRRLAATSQPMKPAPTTTACRAEPACSRSAMLSSKRPQHVDALQIRERRNASWAPARSR